MLQYKNLGGNSGVAAYETGSNSIVVLFTDGKHYRYTSGSTSPGNIATMNVLAASGQGLNSFISRVVKKGFESKW